MSKSSKATGLCSMIAVSCGEACVVSLTDLSTDNPRRQYMRQYSYLINGAVTGSHLGKRKV